MSVSATTAAKRRRAGIQVAASPMFKSGTPITTAISRPSQINAPPTLPQPNLSSQMNANSSANISRQSNVIPQPAAVQRNSQPNMVEQVRVDTKKPMPLQQVISVLDNRILYLESQLINQSKESQLINTDELKTHSVSSSTFTQEVIEDMVVTTIKNHMAEFDHRYELLAGEIVNLKEIVLQLQSYTLDVNKTLLEDRERLLELANRSIERESIAIKQIQEIRESFASRELHKVTLTMDAEVQQAEVQQAEVQQAEVQQAETQQAETQQAETQQAEAEMQVQEVQEEESIQLFQLEDKSVCEDEQLEDSADKKKGKRKAKGKNVMQVSLDDTASSDWGAISTGQ